MKWPIRAALGALSCCPIVAQAQVVHQPPVRGYMGPPGGTLGPPGGTLGQPGGTLGQPGSLGDLRSSLDQVKSLPLEGSTPSNPNGVQNANTMPADTSSSTTDVAVDVRPPPLPPDEPSDDDCNEEEGNQFDSNGNIVARPENCPGADSDAAPAAGSADGPISWWLIVLGAFGGLILLSLIFSFFSRR